MSPAYQLRRFSDELRAAEQRIVVLRAEVEVAGGALMAALVELDIADTLTQHFLRTQIALRTLRAGARTTARLPPRTR